MCVIYVYIFYEHWDKQKHHDYQGQLITKGLVRIVKSSNLNTHQFSQPYNIQYIKFLRNVNFRYVIVVTCAWVIWLICILKDCRPKCKCIYIYSNQQSTYYNWYVTLALPYIVRNNISKLNTTSNCQTKSSSYEYKLLKHYT